MTKVHFPLRMINIVRPRPPVLQGDQAGARRRHDQSAKEKVRILGEIRENKLVAVVVFVVIMYILREYCRS